MESSTPDADRIRQAVEDLRAQALAHKQAAGRHRKATRACLEQAAQLESTINHEPEAISHGHHSHA